MYIAVATTHGILMYTAAVAHSTVSFRSRERKRNKILTEHSQPVRDMGDAQGDWDTKAVFLCAIQAYNAEPKTNKSRSYSKVLVIHQ